MGKETAKPEAWYFRIGDKTSGPHTREEIQNFIRDGHIEPSTWMTRDGDPKWRRARSYRINGEKQPIVEGAKRFANGFMEQWQVEVENRSIPRPESSQPDFWRFGGIMVTCGYVASGISVWGALVNNRPDLLLWAAAILVLAVILRTLLSIEAELKRR